MTGRRLRSPIIQSRRTAQLLGYGGILFGALCLWDAYEGRGRRRPFVTKFLPGG